MSGTVYCKDSIKTALKFLLDNCYFQVGNLIFRQVIGIPMGSDPAPFFANLFLYHYESEWLHTLKNHDYHCARKFNHIFCFIDDLVVINDGHEFKNSYKEIYPDELELKQENNADTAATFLDLDLQIIDGKIITKLYDKRNNYNFFIVRFPYKCSNMPSKIFYSTVSAELLRICRATTNLNNFTLAARAIIDRMLKQGAENSGLKSSIQKMMGRHSSDFLK